MPKSLPRRAWAFVKTMTHIAPTVWKGCALDVLQIDVMAGNFVKAPDLDEQWSEMQKREEAE